MPDYADLTDEEQAEALRPVALAAAADFGLEVDRLEVLAHAFNTTFSLHTRGGSNPRAEATRTGSDTRGGSNTQNGQGPGERFALRVNTNSMSVPSNIVAQQTWQLALAEETPVRVPSPLRTRDGAWFATVRSEALGREVQVTCASWLEGDDVEEPGPEVAHALGAAMAHLHRQAAGWTLPAGATMPRLDAPLFGDPDLLATAELDAEGHEVIRRSRELATATFDRLCAGAEVIPLHGDLHGGNLKWHQGHLAVFDFDDSGLGLPVLDLAISTFYLRGEGEAGEAALRAGYAEVAPLPEVAPDDFEALLASRQLLLANSLLMTTTTQFRELARTYLPATVDRLRHWLETGRFTRHLPGA